MKVIYYLAFLTGLVAVQVSAQDLSVNSTPPVVIASSPISGSILISPTTNRIAIQFSTEMLNNQWSIVKVNGADMPKVTGKVHFKKDNRTFIMPVKLQSDTFYAFSINSTKHKGFSSQSGIAAMPYIISFKTSSKGQ